MKQKIIQIKDGIKINVDVSVKTIMYVKKIIFGKCIWENGKYLASIMDNWVIICDEVTKPYNEEIIPVN